MSARPHLPDQLSEAARGFARRRRKQLLIGGEKVDAADGATFETLDPSTGNVITTIAQARRRRRRPRRRGRARRVRGRADWRKMTPRRPRPPMTRARDAVEDNADELAELESLDNGKPLEVRALRRRRLARVAHLHYFAGWRTKIEGDDAPGLDADMFAYTRREPVGVAGRSSRGTSRC